MSEASIERSWALQTSKEDVPAQHRAQSNSGGQSTGKFLSGIHTVLTVMNAMP